MTRRAATIAWIRAERGFTLLELVIAAALLSGVAATIFFMITTATHGWLLIQGQIDVQQNARIASDRVVNDLQQALDNAVAGTLTVQKATILVCPVAATATTTVVYVQNATDIVTGTVVTLTALSTQISPTTVSAIGSVATCAANGVSGTALTISPAVTSATAPLGLPYGTLLAPIAVTYTVSGTQMTRAGQTLADLVSSLSFTPPASTTLSAQAPAGVTTPTVASTSGLAPGDLIFIGSEIRVISSISGATVNLDQGLFITHTSGESVRKKIVTMQIVDTSTQTSASGGQVQQITNTSEGVPRNPPLK